MKIETGQYGENVNPKDLKKLGLEPERELSKEEERELRKFRMKEKCKIIMEDFSILEEHYKKHPKKFSDRDLGMFKYRHGEMKTYEEVGKKFGVTRERVRQIDSRLLCIVQLTKEYNEQENRE